MAEAALFRLSSFRARLKIFLSFFLFFSFLFGDFVFRVIFLSARIRLHNQDQCDLALGVLCNVRFANETSPGKDPFMNLFVVSRLQHGVVEAKPHLGNVYNVSDINPSYPMAKFIANYLLRT